MLCKNCAESVKYDKWIKQKELCKKCFNDKKKSKKWRSKLMKNFRRIEKQESDRYKKLKEV